MNNDEDSLGGQGKRQKAAGRHLRRATGQNMQQDREGGSREAGSILPPVRQFADPATHAPDFPTSPPSPAPRTAGTPRPGSTGRGSILRLLLVEDDRLLADALSRSLELSGFVVYATAFGEDALDLADAYRFSLILLDLTLPDMPGQKVLQQLREIHNSIPIIILSGNSEIETKVAQLTKGADDYITKPFHPDELVARIRALLRRANAAAPTAVEIGALTIDLSGHRALVRGEVVPLTAKEFACLEFLATRRGMTVTKEMFLRHLYSGRREPEMKIIDVFICKTRRKLREAGAGPTIETVWGRGYTIPGE